jgi:hypothetical protein
MRFMVLIKADHNSEAGATSSKTPQRLTPGGALVSRVAECAGIYLTSSLLRKLIQKVVLYLAGRNPRTRAALAAVTCMCGIKLS